MTSNPCLTIRLALDIPGARRSLFCSNNIRKISNIKRIVDNWYADNSFRMRLDNHSTISMQEFSADEVQVARNFLFGDEINSKLQSYSKAFLMLWSWLYEYKDESTDDIPHEFATWRESCLNFYPAIDKHTNYIPFAFELGQGCSAQCFFCSLSAGALKGNYIASKNNLYYFSEILAMSQKIAGSFAKQSILYWATDPLDNPDYEQFCNTFENIHNKLPYTATALSSVNINRTRDLLDRYLLQVPLRLSFKSLSDYKNICKSFSPEELLFVDIAPQNKESIRPTVLAGRYRKAILKSRKIRLKEEYKRKILHQLSGTHKKEEFNYQTGETNSCLLGYLVNMTTKSISLLHPCYSSGEYPNGYKTVNSVQFTNSDDFYNKCINMLRGTAPLNLHKTTG